MAIRYTFKAYERLKREQHIDTLFRTGKAFSVFPIRFVWLKVSRDADIAPVRVGFSVPKKKFRNSVQRHRIVRLMREVWRLNKHLVYEHIPDTEQVHIFLIFTDTKLPELPVVEEAIIKGIEQLKQKITEQRADSEILPQ